MSHMFICFYSLTTLMMDRLKEPTAPTMAFQLDYWKPAVIFLKPIMKFFQHNTTLSFFPEPCVIAQHVSPKTGLIIRAVFDKKCFFIVDRNNFMPKTINNNLHLLGNFLELAKKHSITKLHVADANDMYLRLHANAGDTRHQIQVACINEQDVILDFQASVATLTLSTKIISDMIHVTKQLLSNKTQYGSKKNKMANNLNVTMTLHESSKVLKFEWPTGELLYNLNEQTVAGHLKFIKLNTKLKTLSDALLCATLGKQGCVLKIYKSIDSSMMVWSVGSSLCKVDAILPAEEVQEIINDLNKEISDVDTDSPTDTDIECVPIKKKC